MFYINVKQALINIKQRQRMTKFRSCRSRAEPLEVSIMTPLQIVQLSAESRELF